MFEHFQIRTARRPGGADDVGAEGRSTSCRYAGNAFHDGESNHGWFVGDFLSPAEHGIRAASTLECKWLTPRMGDHRCSPERVGPVTTVVVLLDGRLRLSFDDGEIVLSRPADYALWTGGPAHGWLAEQDSTVVTVRTPSIRAATPGSRRRLTTYLPRR